MYEIELNLAGTRFDVRVEGRCSPKNIEARFGAYRPGRGALPELSPRASLSVSVIEGWRPPREPAMPFPSAEGETFADGTVRFFRGTDMVLWDPKTRRATGECAYPTRDLPPVADPTPVDTALRLLLSHDLPAHDGLLVHAAGFGDERGAVAFLAPTCGGKTTTARKVPHANVLSDDQVALRRVDGVWRAFALPFIGDYGRATAPREAPLRALVLLEKAPELKLTRLPEGRALARVMNCVVRFLRGTGGAEVLALSGDLVASTPVYSLALSREEPVMPVIERLL